MKFKQRALILVIASGVAACTKTPIQAQPAPAVVQSAAVVTPDYSQFEERYRQENDRICKPMFGLPCHALPHLMGPMNASSANERLACVNGTVAVTVSGNWIPDLKYLDPKTGSRYGDGCIAIAL